MVLIRNNTFISSCIATVFQLLPVRAAQGGGWRGPYVRNIFNGYFGSFRASLMFKAPGSLNNPRLSGHSPRPHTTHARDPNISHDPDFLPDAVHSRSQPQVHSINANTLSDRDHSGRIWHLFGPRQHTLRSICNGHDNT